jgi:hypothetical protein
MPPRGAAARAGLVVAAVVAFNAWYLRSELDPVHYLNDASFHLAYLGWARDRLMAGDSPLDGIFTPLGLGFPLFQHYQVLPYLLTAPLAALFGVQHTFVVVLYLLLVLWPVCVYMSVRWMGFSRGVAVGAAVAAPFVMSVPGYGFELGSYVWRGSGMWTQVWGMWFFALALGLAWRAIFRSGSLALAALLLAATLTSHVLTGLLALAIVAAWGVLAWVAPPVRRAGAAGGPDPGRLLRAAAVAGGGLLASAWLLVPSVIDRRATYFDNPPGTAWSDSFGVRQVLSWLWRGELFDRGRWPVLTGLGAVGLVVLVRCAVGRSAEPGVAELPAGPVRSRRAVRPGDDSARAVLVLFGVSLVLFFGASVVGPVIDRLPGRDVLFLHRMIIGVHFGGLVLAGAGAAWVARAVLRFGTAVAQGRVPPLALAAAVAVVALVGLAPAWTQLRTYLGEQARWIDDQRRAEATDGRDFASLVGIAAAEGGRISAGTRGNGGDAYVIGYVPAYIELLNLGADSIGFTGRIPTLTEPSEARYNGEAIGQSEAFDVRWHIRPSSSPGPPGGHVVASRGRHVLWEVDTGGPVELVDLTAALQTDRGDVALASTSFFNSSMPSDGRYPLLALDGTSPGTPTLAAPVAGRPGTVVSSSAGADGTAYSATVSASRPSALLVKTSYHPRWAATVDGRSAPVVPVAPGLLAVPVPAGTHRVSVHYAGFPVPARLALVLLGALGLGVLWLHDVGRLRLAMLRLPRRPRRPVLTPVGDPPPPAPSVEAGAAG